MATPIPERDDSLDRLEAFCTLLVGTRAEVSSTETTLLAQAHALQEGTSAAAADLRSAADRLSSWNESLGPAVQGAVAELTALAHAAAVLSEQRLAQARASLEAADHAMVAGTARVRESVHHADSEATAALAGMQASAEELESPLAELGRGGEEAFGELEGALGGSRAGLETASRELTGTLEETEVYVADGLMRYLAASFDVLLAHLENEARPALSETIGDVVARSIRGQEEFQAALETFGDGLADAVARGLAQAVREVEQQGRDHQQAASRAEQDALDPMVDEAGKSVTAAAEGGETVTELGALVPSLSTARDVAHEVEEMLDVLNPFD